MANRLLAARDTVLGSTRGHPLVTDAVLAAVVLALSLPPFTSVSGSDPALTLLLILAMVVPLVWRRRWPFAVLLVISVPAIVQLATDRQVTDFLSFLIVFYTIAAYSRPRLVLISLVLLEADIVLGVGQIRTPGSRARTGSLGHATTPLVHEVVVWALATGLIAIAGLLGYYVRTNRRAQATARVEQAEQAERERQQQAQLAASAERARIAREMHDIVAHNIAVMIALADGAAYTAKTDSDQAVELMGQVSATGRTALTEMRRLLGVLRQPADSEQGPQPTLADLDRLLATFRAAGLPVELTVAGQPFALPPSAQLAVYRMITEALTNTLKHAAGSAATVCLEYRDGELELEVSDDGAGLAGGAVGSAGSAGAGRPGGAGVSGGHGITGMRERAAVFGGEMSAGPRPGGGWRVRTILRVEKESA